MQRNPIRVLAALALAWTLTAASSADLLAQERISPFLGGGLALGTGDLAQDTGAGWLFFGGVDLPMRVPGLSVGTTVSHARIPYDGGFDEHESITAVMGEVAYVIGAESPWPVKPFLRGGLGLSIYRYDPGAIGADPQTLSRPGVTADAGITFRVGGAWAFAGARFLGEVDRGYLGIHGGLAIR